MLYSRALQNARVLPTAKVGLSPLRQCGYSIRTLATRFNQMLTKDLKALLNFEPTHDTSRHRNHADQSTGSLSNHLVDGTVLIMERKLRKEKRMLTIYVERAISILLHGIQNNFDCECDCTASLLWGMCTIPVSWHKCDFESVLPSVVLRAAAPVQSLPIFFKWK